MRIAATQYNLEHKAFEIYLSGCSFRCNGCHNPELQSFDIGDIVDDAMIIKLARKIMDSDIIENIWILGGEPLHQDTDELERLLHTLKISKKPIWLFTGEDNPTDFMTVRKYCSYVKSGRYIEELKSPHIEYGVELATSNQHIYKKGTDY